MLAAATIVATTVWFCTNRAPGVLHADPSSSLIDSDGDFLPDAVEWTVITSAANADTDDDTCPDFVEVTQRGAPRHAGVARPMDHEMRAVVTAPSAANPGETTWLHLLFRFVGESTLLTSFNTWLELPALPGLQIPIDLLSFSGVVFEQRLTATEGLWVRLSVPMVPENTLRLVLPCSIQASATIGGRTTRTGVQLFDLEGITSTIIPFGDGRFARQSIGAQPPPPNECSNRVCLMSLELIGSGPAGSVLQVVDCDCEDCNEMECGPSCRDSKGWLIDIPGGLGSLTGG